MVSALLMMRRLAAALRVALREEDFGRILSAAPRRRRRLRTPVTLTGVPSHGASRARTGDLLGAIQALSQTEL
jgi:hypothetical protein